MPLAHVSDPWIIPRQAHAIDSVVWTGLDQQRVVGLEQDVAKMRVLPELFTTANGHDRLALCDPDRFNQTPGSRPSRFC